MFDVFLAMAIIATAVLLALLGKARSSMIAFCTLTFYIGLVLGLPYNMSIVEASIDDILNSSFSGVAFMSITISSVLICNKYPCSDHSNQQ